MAHFIGLQKLAVGVCQTCRSTARSTGQRSFFRPLSQRSTGRSTVARIQSTALCPVDRSVDRGLSREQSSLDGRPGRQTGLLPELGVHVCDFGRPVGRPAEARLGFSGKENLVILAQIKSHKILKNLQKQFYQYTLINKHACTKSRHVTNDLNYFCKLDIFKTCFSKTSPNTKTRYLNSFEAQSVWI